MPEQVVVAAPYDEADLQAFGPIAAQAFNLKEEEVQWYFDLAGREHFRLVRCGGHVCGGCLLIDMGQYYGGERVAMTGVAAVAVDPCQRGEGLATSLMRGALQELRHQGVALSALYSASQPLYRGVGYEHAGVITQARLPLTRVPRWKPTHGVRHLTDADEPATRRLYDSIAPAYDGFLDRPDFIWTRTRSVRDHSKIYSYGLERQGELKGYLRLMQTETKASALDYDLLIKDLVFADAEAGRSLLALLTSHATLADQVRWPSGGSDPVPALLPQQIVKAEAGGRWMLRIVDVGAALRQRGYPVGLSGELHLRIRDDVIEENNGAIVVRIRDGQAEVEPGGDGRMTLGVRALATLYAGHRSPQQLQHTGEIDGPAPDLALAATAFAGPGAWMPDWF
jgi:predicted acetyltransferase